MRLALTAGGTGGHIIPALAVLDVLQAREGLLTDVRFFGPTDRGERASVEARGLAFEEVPSAGVRGRGPVQLAKSAWALGRGVITGTRRLRAFGPDVVFSTGGYGSFPCSVAARILRRPLVVYLPDVTPGWAVSAEKRLASRMATTTDAAMEHLPRRKTMVTGYPVRAAFFATDRAAARRQLGIAEGERVLVVAGATQGARAINRAIFAAAPALAADVHVLHVTGPADEEEGARVREGLPADAQGRYEVAAFRDDLPVAMVAADLGIFRAGASVLGEVPAAGLPAILVPATYAGGHQRDNARWLADAGAAVMVEEATMDLGALTNELMADPPRLGAMAAAARALARPDAADSIANLIVEAARR